MSSEHPSSALDRLPAPVRAALATCRAYEREHGSALEPLLSSWARQQLHDDPQLPLTASGHALDVIAATLALPFVCERLSELRASQPRPDSAAAAVDRDYAAREQEIGQLAERERQLRHCILTGGVDSPASAAQPQMPAPARPQAPREQPLSHRRPSAEPSEAERPTREQPAASRAQEHSPREQPRATRPVGQASDAKEPDSGLAPVVEDLLAELPVEDLLRDAGRKLGKHLFGTTDTSGGQRDGR